MLYLLFQAGTDRYAIETARILEVLPLVAITRIPQAPPEIAGICDRHGRAVPVIDLNHVLTGRPADHRLSTRLLIVDCADRAGRPQRIGLLAERATDTMRRDPADFVSSGLANRRAPYLGRVASDAGGLVQLIAVEAVLPDTVVDMLCATVAG